MNISISRDGVEIGEWTEEKVRSLYSEGELKATDHYWKEGMSEWKELGTFIKPPPPPSRKATARIPSLSDIELEYSSPDIAPAASLPACPPPIPEQINLSTPEQISPGRKQRNWKQESLGCLGRLPYVIGLGVGLTFYKSHHVPMAAMLAGGLLGYGIGMIPHLLLRFHYKANDYKKYDYCIWVAATIGAVAGLLLAPTLAANAFNEELSHFSSSIALLKPF
jgi:hypothetical protein